MDSIKRSRRTSFQNILINFQQVPLLNLSNAQPKPFNASPSLLQLPVANTIKYEGGSCKHLNKSARPSLYSQKAQVLAKSQKLLSLLHSSTNSLRSSFKNSNRLTLANLKNLSMSLTLSLLIKILKECYQTHKRLNYSYFEVEDCQLTHEGKISINMENTEIIHDEASIVKKIIFNMQSISCKYYEDFLNFYQRVQKSNKCDYKYIISLIKSYSQCSQIQLSDNIFDLKGSIKTSKTDLNKSLKCTQNMFFSKKNIRRTSNNSLETQEVLNTLQKTPKLGQKSISFKKIQKQSQRQSKSLKNLKLTTQVTSNFHTDHKFKSAEKKPHIKQSCASTNVKTSTHHQSLKEDCFQSSLTFGGKCGNFYFKYQNLDNMNEFKSQEKDKKSPINNKQITPFKQIRLQQVQSQTQSQEADKQSVQVLKKSKLLQMKQAKSIQSQAKPEAYTKMMQQNHWQQNIDHKLIQNKQLASSYIVSKDQQKEERYKAQKLGQLARVMTESLLDTGFTTNSNEKNKNE